MKKILTYLFLACAVFMNIYLIFYWNPINNEYSEDKESREVISHVKSIYKVNKDEAISKLSDMDKNDLIRIVNKLSAYDIGKIKNYIEYTNEEDGIINAFKLLKTRLSKENYEKIKEICSTFLDIKQLEKQL